MSISETEIERSEEEKLVKSKEKEHKGEVAGSITQLFG